MARKIISGTLIGLGSLLLVLSVVGIGAVWIYRQPLITNSTARLQTIDNDLAEAQSAFQSARLELERTLRLVESAEASMEALKDEFAQVKTLFDKTTGILDDQLLPGLLASRGKLDQAKTSLQGLRDTLTELNKSLQFLDLNLPGDKLLGDLIASADSLDGQIVRVEDLVNNASTFVSDASYLMGSDFTETKTNLNNFLAIVTEYDQKLIDWRVQVAELLASLPGWITGASIGLTLFLLWFGISQVSLILHGLAARQGGDPLAVLRKPVVEGPKG
jgi:F0F1-type ATP synthase membrane subunit b/b'